MLDDFYVVNNFGAELYNNALQDLLRQASLCLRDL